MKVAITLGDGADKPIRSFDLGTEADSDFPAEMQFVLTEIMAIYAAYLHCLHVDGEFNNDFFCENFGSNRAEINALELTKGQTAMEWFYNNTIQLQDVIESKKSEDDQKSI